MVLGSAHNHCQALIAGKSDDIRVYCLPGVQHGVAKLIVGPKRQLQAPLLTERPSAQGDLLNGTRRDENLRKQRHRTCDDASAKAWLQHGATAMVIFYMKLISAALLVLCLSVPLLAQPVPSDGKQHKLTLHDGNFYIDDTPFRIFAGEIHPGRIPPEFWDDRIKKAKAMGLNTVSVYLFWNEIEPSEGNFVFADNTDIRRFAQLCQ